MPYIEPKDKGQYEGPINTMFNPWYVLNKGQTHPEKQKIPAGHLNYVITRSCHKFIEENGESYATYNEVMGVLECAKEELYRRKVAPYEDTKIAQNGDV